MARTHKQDKPITSPLVSVVGAFLTMLSSRQENAKLDAEVKAIAQNDPKAIARIKESSVYAKAYKLNAMVRRQSENVVIAQITHALWRCNDSELKQILTIVREKFPKAEVVDSKHGELIATFFSAEGK